MPDKMNEEYKRVQRLMSREKELERRSRLPIAEQKKEHEYEILLFLTLPLFFFMEFLAIGFLIENVNTDDTILAALALIVLFAIPFAISVGQMLLRKFLGMPVLYLIFFVEYIVMLNIIFNAYKQL